MKKQTVVEVFGSLREAEKAMQVSRQAFSRWPDELSFELESKVLARILYMGKFRRLLELADAGVRDEQAEPID